MKVLDLKDGKELHGDQNANPYIVCPGHGLRPAGHILELTTPGCPIIQENAELIETWLRDPQNDCLRARGDYAWQVVNGAWQYR